MQALDLRNDVGFGDRDDLDSLSKMTGDRLTDFVQLDTEAVARLFNCSKNIAFDAADTGFEPGAKSPAPLKRPRLGIVISIDDLCNALLRPIDEGFGLRLRSIRAAFDFSTPSSTLPMSLLASAKIGRMYATASFCNSAIALAFVAP